MSMHLSLPGAGQPVEQLEPLGVPIAQFGSIIRRRLWVVVACFAVGAGGASYLVSRMPREYTAEASLLIEPQRTQVSDLQAISADATDISSLVRTQIDILSAPALAIGVVEALHLAHDPEFAPAPPSALHRWLEDFEVSLGLKGPSVPLPKDPVEAAANAVSRQISFANEPHSSVLSLAVTTREPAKSAAIANEFARQYLAFKTQEKFSAMQRARDWFEGQLGALSEQLRADEGRVEHYREEHGLRDELPSELGTAPAASVNRQQLDEISSLLSQAARDRADKEAELAAAGTPGSDPNTMASLPAVVNSNTIGELTEQLNTAAGREAELAAREGDRNPDLVQARAQVARLQAQLQRSMSHVKRSISAEVAAARGQEEALRARLGSLRDAVGDENAARLGLQALETKARATRTIYESFLNRATELANVAGIQEPDASLVSNARAPLAPSSPKSARLVAVASLLSIVVGVGLACLLERMRKGFTRPEQLEAALGLPLLGLVPTEKGRLLMSGSRNRVNAFRVSASLDKVRGRLRALGENRPRIIMVTSSLPSEGKSMFSGRFAENTAAAGWRVLLVDCDFDHPGASNLLEERNLPGLAELLDGRITGGAFPVRALSPLLDILPAGNSLTDPQELLASSRMGDFLAFCRTRYDLVILDTPPVLPVADAVVLARHADATLMIVRWEETAREAVEAAVRLLRDSGARILGTIMTRVDQRISTKASGLSSPSSYRRYNGYGLVRNIAKIG